MSQPLLSQRSALGLVQSQLSDAFSPTAKLAMFFSPEKLWRDPVQLQHQVPEKVPEGSGAFQCRLLMRLRRVPVQMADEVPDSSGAAG